MAQNIQINKCDTSHLQIKENQMIITIETEKEFDKIQYTFVIKKNT